MAGREDAPTGPGEDDEGANSSDGSEASEWDDLSQLVPENFSAYALTPAQEERRHVLAQAAIGYAQRGWKVVPVRWVDEENHCSCKLAEECDSAGKHPIHVNWPEIATSDPLEVASWWREPPEGTIATEWYPQANIGIVAGRGSNLFILDEDTYNGGERTLDNYRQRHGDLPLTRIHTTGGGGKHYLFTYPGFQIHNNAGKNLGQGLDIKGDRGFVVAPPSVSSKGTYYIENPAHDIDPVPAPEWLLELLQSYDTEQRGGGHVDPDLLPSNLVSAYVQAALDSETEEVRTARVGSRNERLNSAAFSLGTLGALGLLDDKTAWNALSTAATEAGLGQAETFATFWSGWKSGLDSPRKEIPLKYITDAGRRFPQNEFGLGARMVFMYGDILQWVTEIQRYMIFGNGLWRPCKEDNAEVFASAMLSDLADLGAGAYDDDPLEDKEGKPIVDKEGNEVTPRSKYISWATAPAQQSAKRINTTVKVARSMPGLRTSMELFDSNPMTFVWGNGLMQLQTGELGKHDPQALSTMGSTVRFDPDADQSMWLTYLGEVMPDPEMQAYLKRISGYCLTGLTTEQAAILHWGGGANGKSVWLECMAHVVGGYSQVVPASTLLLKPTGTIPNDVARMRGRRFLQVSETPQGKRLDEEVVKSLTGGELTTARFMRGEYFDFKPTGKINLVTNHLPHLSPSHSIWRRLHMVPWTVTIAEEDQDKELARKLIEQAASGIAAWAVQGCLEWQQIGLCPPDPALVSKQEYRESENRIAQWVADEVDVVYDSAGVAVGRTNTEFWESFQAWCRANGFKEPGTRRSFITALQEEGYEYHGKGGPKQRGFPGLQLRRPDLT